MSRSRSRGAGRSVGSLLKMRSLGSLGFLAVLAFYVAWPLYAGYEIRSGLERHDVEGLHARIDFASVRDSLRPAVTAQVDRVVTDALRKSGSLGETLGDRLKAQVMPRIVDGVLAALVTPEMLIRVHDSGKSFKEAIDALVLERAAAAHGVGGFQILPDDAATGGTSRLDAIASKYGIDVGKVLGGKAPAASERAAPAAGVSAAHDARPKYGIGNIKRFALNGPLGLSIGVARDPAARQPDVTAELSFVGGSWKLTGLVPRA